MDLKEWRERYVAHRASDETPDEEALNANGLLDVADSLLSRGGEIAQTLAWHEAVNEAKEREFGEQPLLEKLRLASTLVSEETLELEAELRAARSFIIHSTPIPLEVRAAAAKEAADVLFVVMQAMYTLGIPFEEVYAEVMRSNRSKLEGGIRFREDGKLLKGDRYSPADVMRVLEAHEGEDN